MPILVKYSQAAPRPTASAIAVRLGMEKSKRRRGMEKSKRRRGMEKRKMRRGMEKSKRR